MSNWRWNRFYSPRLYDSPPVDLDPSRLSRALIVGATADSRSDPVRTGYGCDARYGGRSQRTRDPTRLEQDIGGSFAARPRHRWGEARSLSEPSDLELAIRIIGETRRGYPTKLAAALLHLGLVLSIFRSSSASASVIAVPSASISLLGSDTLAIFQDLRVSSRPRADPYADPAFKDSTEVYRLHKKCLVKD
ncbi:eukaryotic translation initiation factor 2 [Musa troglodytarum]|uniref:Eukaryotic translation initiation factor 2 n=1 Tax=Musa troglodytarum TaxID=320322 RepID=A0A9E7KM69_9LILI|nr:eukaryotic translation initiation factor 2 [Musa troglodytarum]